MISTNFTSQHSLAERRSLFAMLTQVHDKRIPVLVRTLEGKSRGQHFELFLTKPSASLYQLVFKIKKKIAMNPRNTVYLFCHNRMLSPHAFISQIYEKYQAEDGFLYIDVASTPSLGCFAHTN